MTYDGRTFAIHKDKTRTLNLPEYLCRFRKFTTGAAVRQRNNVIKPGATSIISASVSGHMDYRYCLDDCGICPASITLISLL